MCNGPVEDDTLNQGVAKMCNGNWNNTENKNYNLLITEMV